MVSLVESGESGTSVKDDRSLEYPEEEDVVEGKGDLKGLQWQDLCGPNIFRVSWTLKVVLAIIGCGC